MTKTICVHLDLKGVAFKPSYIPQLLEDLASQRVNTVLVEYEDLFPFDGLDIATDKSVVWSKRTHATFLKHAAKHKIDVVPLQQCLGHLEYLYRWDRFRNFAENRKYPSTLKLSSKPARAQILGMLGQVIDAHPDSKYVHLGMDEAHAMVQYAKKAGKDVVDVFLDWLDELCDFCEARGKTPLIWSDMLEDHFKAGVFDRFKNRVILVPWDYTTTGEWVGTTRFGGFRVSKEWLDDAGNPAAPSVNAGTTFIEDLPKRVRDLLAPYKQGRTVRSMMQVDVWTALGFKVLGATAIRSSVNLAVLPKYNMQWANIDAWAAAIKRNKQQGIVGTSWARGTTWCPPGFNIDLTWPSIAHMARAIGAKPKPFWPGVPAKTVERLMRQLGASREHWSIELKVADEMDALLPKVKAHRYEWQSIALLARVWNLHRRANYAVEEVDFFHANNHPVPSEWQRRLDDQRAVLADIKSLRKKVRTHFGKRYEGDAFNEWVTDLFDLHESKVKACSPICKRKQAEARKRYSK